MCGEGSGGAGLAGIGLRGSAEPRMGPGVSGPDNDRTIFPMSLCGPEISGPDNDQIVLGCSLVLVVVWSCYTGDEQEEQELIRSNSEYCIHPCFSRTQEKDTPQLLS